MFLFPHFRGELGLTADAQAAEGRAGGRPRQSGADPADWCRKLGFHGLFSVLLPHPPWPYLPRSSMLTTDVYPGGGHLKKGQQMRCFPRWLSLIGRRCPGNGSCTAVVP